MPRAGSPLLLGLVLLAGSVLFFCLSAEMACRAFFPDHRLRYVTDPELMFVLEPNQQDADVGCQVRSIPYAGSHVRINELGLRGPGVASLSSRHVLFLGDSFTFGSLIEEERTFVGRVSGCLPEDISAINGGQPGFGIYQIAGFGRRLVPSLRPEVVVLVIWEGLLQRQPLPAAERAHVLAKSEKLKRLKATSVLGMHLYRAWERASWRLGVRATTVTLTQSTEPVPSADGSFSALFAGDGRRIEMLAGAVADSGGRMMIVLWPESEFTGRDRPPTSSEVDAWLRELAERLGLAYVNLGPALSAYPPGHLIISGDGHPTALAHCLAAEVMLDELGRLGWYEIAALDCQSTVIGSAEQHE